MRKIVVSQFVTLDGVMEYRGGAEKFELGGWAFKFQRGDDGDRFKLDEVMAADGLLLGRTTYEGFAAAWPDRTDEAGFADKFNSMPKYVVSTTLRDPEWNNSHVVSVEDVKDLDGELLVNGSNTLIQALMEHDLVDEYRLMVFPTVLGKGKRLFDEGRPQADLKLTDCRPVGPDGVAVMVYEPVS
jgi:dihydrofolate reductase